MNYTVIVAEDEELLLNNLVHKIEKADPDFQVIGTAQTGAQALSLVEQMSPDVVFTDIKMPVMDGWEAARLIRASQHPDAQKVALLALSANAFVEDARRSEALGMDGHVGKPIDFDQLDALLKRAFSVRRPMRKALV